MDEAERSALRAAIELLHGCRAEFRNSETVSVDLQGARVWRRKVAVFSLSGHATARLCYAWTDRDPQDAKVHHRVVLHSGPVRSTRDAVSAYFLANTPAGIAQ
jgi:hypothetical protein